MYTTIIIIIAIARIVFFSHTTSQHLDRIPLQAAMSTATTNFDVAELHVLAAGGLSAQNAVCHRL
jgi:hypothetical protein